MGDLRGISVRLGSAEDVEPRLDAICDLYDETFSASPFRWTTGESSRHRDMVQRMIADPSFGLALAETSHSAAIGLP